MKITLIILDSVGIGELTDAKDYGDTGANTLVNIKKQRPDLNLKNMLNLGLSSIDGANELLNGQTITPKGTFGKLAELSKGKDTTIGHFEIAGVETKIPFPTFPNGFPLEIITKFENATGRKVIGNVVASGTEIIDRLGKQSVQEGSLIVYTSADSVFQIACHEDVVPIAELYKICEKARTILDGKYKVARVIARPFTGTFPNFKRTANRKDYSVLPDGKTMLEYIKEAGKDVVAIGKIEDIFSGVGITKAIHTNGNQNGIDITITEMQKPYDGLIFTNLVDFDMLYGHRRDINGYADALLYFDERLPEIIENLGEQDALIITADHGCDPTFKGTDHTREYIPILIYGKNIKQNYNLKTRKSFADISATILEMLNIENQQTTGESFYKEIKLN